MSFYPGDTFTFILNIPDTGSTVVSSAPTITVLNVATPGSPIVTAASMTLLTGTTFVYKYAFTIPAGTPADFVGLVSYATTSPAATINSQFLQTFHVGDSFITAPVAQQSTVALDATVAKAATTLSAAAYVPPGSDSTVQAIATAVAAIQTDTDATQGTLGSLAGGGSLSALIQDLYDAQFGSWSINQAVNPPVLTLKRINGSIFATYNLVNNNTVTQRNMATNPGDSSI